MGYLAYVSCALPTDLANEVVFGKNAMGNTGMFASRSSHGVVRIWQYAKKYC
jgi:hypothetical protein